MGARELKVVGLLLTIAVVWFATRGLWRDLISPPIVGLWASLIILSVDVWLLVSLGNRNHGPDRPGIRIWMIMLGIAVAAGAALTARERMRARSWARNAMATAAGHEMKATLCRAKLQAYQEAIEHNAGKDGELMKYWESVVEGEREIANYHERLSQKYTEAARYPWLPLAPDPPEPTRPRKPAFLR